MAKPDCPGCRILRKQVAFLEARIRELEQRLCLNATNSSIPPSANPPQAPPPVVNSRRAESLAVNQGIKPFSAFAFRPNACSTGFN
jgi:Family of unknown function (DUF6444)